MLNRRAQVVIAIGILILAIAFFLVGLNFATLQGLFFQNGAASLQMFANNIGAAQNAIYSAPSSMSITLSGNTSLCQWVPAIDAYTCAGGSKIYNVSYANGPTLDVGKNIFSFDLCVMVGLGPTAVKGLAGKITDFIGPSIDEAVVKSVTGSFVERGLISEQAANEIGDKVLVSAANKGINNPVTMERMIKRAVINSLDFQANVDVGIGQFFKLTDDIESFDAAEGVVSEGVTSGTSLFNDFGSFIGVGLSKVAENFAVNAGIGLASFGLGALSPQAYYWFSTAAAAASKFVSPTNPVFSRFGLPPIKVNAQIQSNSVLATYETFSPIPSTGGALNLELQKFVQVADNLQAIDNLPSSIFKDNLLYEAGQAIGTGKDVLNELANYNLNQNNTSPYSTPAEGVSAPGKINSTSNNFISSATLNGLPSGNGDPILQMTGLIADTAFMTAARSALCLGDLQYAFSRTGYTSATSSVSSLGSIIGAAASLVNVYTRINMVLQSGTYLVGYGGEVYLNGRADSRPQEISVPVIVDMQDICSIAQNTYKQGVHLQSMIQPSGNGSISFSLNQGMINTLCSTSDNLFPQPVSSFVNDVLSAPSGSSVSILLPPKYAIGFLGNQNSNGLSQDVGICLFNILITDKGVPQVYRSKNSYTELGTESSCINISNMSSGEYQINLNNNNGDVAGKSALSSGNEFHLNSNFTIGFSTPIRDYPSGGNFISGGAPVFNVQSGVDSPLVNLILGLAHKGAVRAQLPSELNPLQYVLSGFSRILSQYTPNMGFYETEYSNITFTVSRSGNTITLTPYNESLVFGIFPNSVTDLGGSYTG